MSNENRGADVHHICDPDILSNLRAPGRFDVMVGSKEEALGYASAAFPNAAELPEAIAGKPYPNPPAGLKAWYQVQPAEPEVGNVLPHIKYSDWTMGKKVTGGTWGHIFFPG